ncbi:MAG: tRNA 2-thiocytidine(32) synthetase TtcA [Colwellia sp.]|jgi:tRNA 2-thiocytidine biosynthesis protein TtcA|uniref:tRNA 2-thiocytidine(32) synthetase TtcA n=1 Tax=Colwellia sp. Bg11-12 TaxID=2759817 RepID=UPI0015F54FAE|nr:tRNA 2-thiocytidine(32) synthetase TtcA [Colwellia sp. Bg11-12]MBA6263720.1 tRNA 2-thiocytidine(32) synthetase TtcA [Colwellia sp. Bg11-12]
MSAQSATPITTLTASQKIQLSKLEKRLRRHVGQAIAQYNMIEDGDKIMVCVSGGKDSYALLAILMLLKESAPIHFDIVAVNLDQKQPGFPEHILPAYLESLGVEYKIAQEDTYSIVKDKIPEGKTTCSLCSRLRRAILYKVAAEIGATKIALGHHRDDMVETLMLNMFYGGKLKSMPAKLVSDNGEHVVIRPLAFCKEAELIQYAQLKAFPIIPCNLCGSQPNLQRQNIKKMLQDWNVNHPGRIESMFTAIRNVVPSHLCDSELFDFKAINAQSGVINGGDIAFDDELIVAPQLTDNINIEHNSKNNLSFNNALNIIEIK